MKKNVIALAIAAAVAAPAANAAPTVYGIANMAFQMDAKGKDSGQSVDSVVSRVGVKGSEDLGSGLKAVYKFEFQVNIDSENNSTTGAKTTPSLTARNQYVGLAGGFGTVLMGRHDTPLKMSQPKDLFNDGLLDNDKMTNIGFGNTKGGEDRVAQTLAYVSPSFGGVKLAAALVPNEAATPAKDSAITNISSLAAMYGSKKKGLYLAAALNVADDKSGDQKYGRISAQYAVDGLVANAMYQKSSAAGAEGSNIMIGAAYKMGKFMPKLKYSMNFEDKKSGKEGTVAALGVDYSLGKKTKAYLEFGMFDDDFAGGKSTSYNSTSIGLQHKF